MASAAQETRLTDLVDHYRDTPNSYLGLIVL